MDSTELEGVLTMESDRGGSVRLMGEENLVTESSVLSSLEGLQGLGFHVVVFLHQGS